MDLCEDEGETEDALGFGTGLVLLWIVNWDWWGALVVKKEMMGQCQDMLSFEEKREGAEWILRWIMKRNAN